MIFTYKDYTNKRNLVGIVMLAISLGGLVLGILVMNTRTALNMTERHGEMIHATLEVKYKTTRFHLWLEELLSGDPTLTRDKVWKNLDSAKNHTLSLLSIGEAEHIFEDSEDSIELRTGIEKTLVLLEQLGVVAEQRLSNVSESVAGKPIDAEFDALFEVVLEHAGLSEDLLHKLIAADKHEYRIFTFIMGVVILFPTFLYAYFLYQNERRRIKNTLKIQEGETRIRTVLNSIEEGIITTDYRGYIESSNPATSELFEYRSDRLIGKKISLLIPELEEKPHNLSCTFEYEGKRQNGLAFPVAVTINEMWLEDKQLFIISVRDITQYKRAEQAQREYSNNLEMRVREQTAALSAALELAEKSSEAKSNFLSHMSHELRTPMNAILGFGQILDNNAKGLDETQQGNVKQIIRAGHHLMDLINEVLDLARIESGKLDISLDKVLVDDVLQESIDLVEPKAKTRQVTIIDNLSSRDYVVQADSIRLKQVLVNLLSNAVKYNCDQGVITLDGEIVDRKYLRIQVTDTGSGLTENEIINLYTPFERLNVTNNVEGTGIGLTITKNLVELMGGNIGVSSIKGEGSTFWVELALIA